MNNYYQLLGITRGASASVVKIAYEGKLKSLKASGLAEAQQQAEARELERAYVTLSNPAKAKWYEGQLEKHVASESAPGMRTGIVTAVLALFVVGGAAAWYFQDRARTREALQQQELRLQVEQKRMALERERDAQAKELELARAEQSSQGVRTQRYDVRVGRTDREMALQERAYSDAQAYREQAQTRTLQTYDRREVEHTEDRNRRQADDDRRKALAEVERQKRFVRDRELEDERARISRDQRVRQEQYDRQRREAIEALKTRQ